MGSPMTTAASPTAAAGVPTTTINPARKLQSGAEDNVAGAAREKVGNSPYQAAPMAHTEKPSATAIVMVKNHPARAAFFSRGDTRCSTFPVTFAVGSIRAGSGLR